MTSTAACVGCCTMTIHSSLYLGPYDWNFSSLRPDTNTYKTREDETRPAERPEVKGIHFGYMEKPGKAFLLVRVDDIVLRNPVLRTERHQDGKGAGPVETKFGDEAAARYLLDAIVENPELRDLLGAKLRGLL